MQTEHLHRALHAVNNLLAVIYTQAALAKARDDAVGARAAIEEIERCARRVEPEVRRAMLQVEGQSG